MKRTGCDAMVPFVATRSYVPGVALGSPAGHPTCDLARVHDTAWVTF